QLEPPSLLSLENCSPTPAIRAGDDLISHLGAENHCVRKQTGCSVLNAFQPKSMVKYRCGHGSDLLRSVRLASNNTDGPCHVHFLFSKAIRYSGTRFPEEPHFSELRHS